MVKTTESCPVCRNEDATCTHGVRDGFHPEVFVHTWECPDCGISHLIVAYDCPVCKQTEDETMAELQRGT
jgi:C4-type Zn-finger protein